MQTYEFQGPDKTIQFVGELPSGQRAMSMFHEVAAIAKKIGAFELKDGAAVAYSISMIAALPNARALALSTLAGWKADGREVTSESFDEMFCRKGFWLVPYTMAFRIWRDSGFFGD